MGNMNQNEIESNQRIKKGAIVSYIAIIVNILAGLLFTPWMINQIGQSSYGLYTLAVSVISIFTIDFGLSAAVSRFVSKYHAENKQSSINKMLSVTYRLYFLIDILILIALIVVYFNIDLIYQELTINELEKFKVVYIMAATFSLISFPAIPFNGILSAYEYFVEMKLADLIQRLAIVGLIAFALLNGLGLYAVVAANAIGGLIAIVYKFIILKKMTTVKIDLTYHDNQVIKEILGFSTWSAIAGIAQRFIFNITPTILGIVSGTSSIAIFAIASALESYVYTIASALNGLFLPKVSRIVSQEKASENILELMIKIGRIQLIIIGLITIGFISVGQDFILLWMGDGYSSAYYSAIFLILPSIIYLPQQIGNTAVVALNKVKQQAVVFTLMAIINIALSFILSSYYGVLGGSIAIFIAYTFRSVGMNVIFKRSLNIDILKYFKECHFKFIIPQGIVLLLGISLNLLPLRLSWMNLLIKGFLLVAIYSIVTWTFIMNTYEKQLIKGVINLGSAKIKKN